MKKKVWLIPALAIVSAAIINFFFIINARIPSGSMESTIDSGSFVIGNRLAYFARDPQAGDIVFFRDEEITSSLLIKRVIATPGMRFAVRDGRVYINGELIDEEYVDHFGKDDFDEITVPEDCYVVLGDNRTESNDSRHWEDPFITKKQIKAKATYVWFPQLKKLDTE